MKTIIETTQLEFDKSDFLIDLIRHENGMLYIEVVQIIFNSEEGNKSIKINPTNLPEIIKVLQKYLSKIPNSLIEKNNVEIEQQKIQERYLKGISIEELALQFDQTPKIIESILRNRGIEIVENKVAKSRFWKKGIKKKGRK